MELENRLRKVLTEEMLPLRLDLVQRLGSAASSEATSTQAMHHQQNLSLRCVSAICVLCLLGAVDRVPLL